MSRRAHAWLTEHFGVRLPRMSLPEALRLWIRHQEDALRSVAHELPVPRTPLILEGKEETRLIIRLLSGAEEGSVVVLERLQAAVRPASLESRFALTEREAEVLAWVAQGKSNSEVASIIHARPRTIEKHLEHVYKKLGVENRFAAMLAVVGESIAQLMS
jgi:DNA-binding CsgD family transcriptional regulator